MSIMYSRIRKIRILEEAKQSSGLEKNSRNPDFNFIFQIIRVKRIFPCIYIACKSTYRFYEWNYDGQIYIGF